MSFLSTNSYLADRNTNQYAITLELKTLCRFSTCLWPHHLNILYLSLRLPVSPHDVVIGCDVIANANANANHTTDLISIVAFFK